MPEETTTCPRPCLYSARSGTWGRSVGRGSASVHCLQLYRATGLLHGWCACHLVGTGSLHSVSVFPLWNEVPSPCSQIPVIGPHSVFVHTSRSLHNSSAALGSCRDSDANILFAVPNMFGRRAANLHNSGPKGFTGWMCSGLNSQSQEGMLQVHVTVVEQSLDLACVLY
jgi:hypothetical protein